MNRIIKRLFQIVLFAPLCLPLTACALSGQALEGQVLEAETKKPLIDSLVVARWQGTYSAIAETKTVCYHVETATTDAEGRYRMPAWSAESKGPFFSPETVIVTAYKLGYEIYSPPGFVRSEEYRQNIRYLQPFAGGREERLKYLERAEQSIRTCRSPQAEEKNLLPLYRAFYEEAKSLAKTKEDQKIADGFLAGMEIIELGYKEGMRRALERAEKRDRQP
jgi:hypothetical protein